MRYPLLLLAAVAWALWFGATVSLFVFGWHYFRPGVMPSHEAAAGAANAMFLAFTPYEMALAGVGLLSAAVGVAAVPSRWTLGLLAGFVGATCMAITFGLGLLPRMEGMRQQGLTGTDQWRKLHGQSMMTLSIQALILLGTGALLVGMAGVTRRRAAGVTESPAGEVPTAFG
jgi:hypothetical protein